MISKLIERSFFSYTYRFRENITSKASLVSKSSKLHVSLTFYLVFFRDFLFGWLEACFILQSLVEWSLFFL